MGRFTWQSRQEYNDQQLEKWRRFFAQHEIVEARDRYMRLQTRHPDGEVTIMGQAEIVGLEHHLLIVGDMVPCILRSSRCFEAEHAPAAMCQWIAGSNLDYIQEKVWAGMGSDMRYADPAVACADLRDLLIERGTAVPEECSWDELIDLCEQAEHQDIADALECLRRDQHGSTMLMDMQEAYERAGGDLEVCLGVVPQQAVFMAKALCERVAQLT